MDNLTNTLSKCSLNDSLYEKYEKDKTKNWIKLIPFNKTINFNDYIRKDKFKLVANIILDNEIKTNGKKKRQTLILFEPAILLNEFDEMTTEWIYIFTINNMIVKIGGTRTGLRGRTDSYICGHHIKERGKSGDCSKTNGFIYNTFDFYAQLNYSIKMYAYKLPKTEIDINIFNIKVKVYAQTFHAYESTLINDYIKHYNNMPTLCDNSDPNYKNK